MVSAFTLGLVAAAAALTNAQTADNTTFAPVLNPDVNVHNISNVVPQTNVTLVYSDANTPASVNVSHIMKYPSIILEEIAAITSVVCSDTQVLLTFNNATVLNALNASWNADERDFVLITNHLGDCDVELERGLFVANTITCDATTLVCTALVSKTDIQSTAAFTAIDFANIPTAALESRTTIDTSFSLGGTIALPADTSLYSLKDHIAVTADSASVTAKTTFSGHLYFDWWILTLESCYFDIDADFSANLALSVNVTSSWSNTFEYTTPSITLPAINIQGLFTVTPTLNFILGATLSAAETLDMESNVVVGITDGNLHLDLVNYKKTGTSGWTPTHTTDLTISGAASAEFNPFIILDVHAELDISGVPLAAEALVHAGFNNTISVVGSTNVGTKGVTSTTTTGTCANGLELDTKFVFGVDVYMLGMYIESLYPLDVTLWDMCFGATA